MTGPRSIAVIVVAAGRSQKYNNKAMSQLMIRYLDELGVTSSLLLSLISPVFRTVGEIKELWRHMLKLRRREGCEYEVVCVNRWWHAPRTKRLLWAHLPKELEPHVTITMQAAPSATYKQERFTEFRAWVRNLPAIIYGQIRMTLH